MIVTSHPRPPAARRAVAGLLAAGALAACAPPAAPPPALPPTPDPGPAAAAAAAFPFGGVGRRDSVAPGVWHEAFVIPADSAHGRWAVHVLRTAPSMCVAAVKAGGMAVGRATTSALATQFARRDTAAYDSTVAGAVNADFFSFTPPGVPGSAHVEGGRVIAGPAADSVPRPVFAVDSAGRPWIGVLATTGGFVRNGTDTLPVTAWNRPAPGGVGVFDAGWGARTDSAPGRLFVRLRPESAFASSRDGARPERHRVVVTESAATATLGPRAVVAAIDADAPADVRARWATVRVGEELDFAVAFAPVRPREAVGGRPVLLRAGAATADVDTVGPASFRDLNPRTAVGVTADGGLLLVTIDGRQPGHSDGATLRETAELLRALGAVDALNLDGGGSTTMVVRGPDGRLAVVNRTSDPTGERPVANALAVRACGAR